MKRRNTKNTGARTVCLHMFAAVVSLALAFVANAQVVMVTSDSTVTISTNVNYNGGASIGYKVDDGYTLTIQPGTGTNRGYNIGSGSGGVLELLPSTSGGTGRIIVKDFNYNASAGGQGGAIFIRASGTVFGANIDFLNNRAHGHTTSMGGAITAQQGGTAILTNALFSGNYAQISGGAITATLGGMTTITGFEFSDNYVFGDTAASQGGAISNSGTGTNTNPPGLPSTLTLTNGAFLRNRSSNNGGAIANTTEGVAHLKNVTFAGNWAMNAGGAIYQTHTPSAFTLEYTSEGGVSAYENVGNIAGGLAPGSGTVAPAASAKAGGFFFSGTPGTGGTLTFNIGSGASLTIGSATAAQAGADSIASEGADMVITKTGAGDLILNADNAYYQGSFAINEGRVLLGNNNARLGGTITVASGATLGGTGTFAAFAQDDTALVSSVIANAGSIIEIGSSSTEAGLLVFEDLKFDGATIKFDLFGWDGSGYASDQLHVAGMLDLASSGTIEVSTFATGTYSLGNLAAVKNNLTAIIGAGGGSRQQVDLEEGLPGELLLITAADQSRILTWTGGAGLVWAATPGSWTNPDSYDEFASGDHVVFDDTGALPVNRTITIGASGVTASEMTVTGGGYVFEGQGGITTGTRFVQPADIPGDTIATSGKLKKSGAGTLTFANTAANNFEGGIEMGGGVIVVSRGDHLGTLGTDGVNYGITFAGSGTLRASADITGGFAGNSIIGAGKNAAFDTNGYNIFYTGTISLAGATGTFSKIGAGQLVLSSGGDASGLVTEVGGGGLLLNGATLGGTVHARAGALFGGAGSAPGTDSVRLYTSSTLQVGYNDTGRLDIARLVVQDGATIIGSGTLSGSGTFVGGAVTLAVDASKQISLAGVLDGEATLTKTGEGTVAIESGARLSAGTINLNAGRLALREGGGLAVSTALTIGAFAELRGSGTVAAPLLTNRGAIRVGRAADAAAPYGRLVVSGNSYAGDGGTIYLNAGVSGDTAVYDQFVLNGLNVSGTTTLVVTTDSLLSADQIMSVVPVDLTGATIAADADIGMAEGEGITVSDSLYRYAYTMADGWYPMGYVPPLPAFLGMDAASLLITSAALDSAGSHIMALRGIKHEPKARVWVNSLYRHDKISSSLYDGAKVETRGAQVGLDWGHANSNEDDSLAIGVFYDFVMSSLDIPDRTSSTDTDANGIGAYFAYEHERWYAAGIYRRSFEDYDVTAHGMGTVDTKGRGWAVSVEGGYKILDRPNWKAEIYGQYIYQTHKINDCVDTENRLYQFKETRSSMLRSGIRVWREFALRSGVIIRPYLRGSYAYEQNAETDMTVTTLSNDLRWKFKNDMGGGGAIFDAGVTLELSKRFLFAAGGSWRSVGEVESYNFNFGANIAW